VCKNSYTNLAEGRLLPRKRPDGAARLEALVMEIRRHGAGRRDDCVIAVRGGDGRASPDSASGAVGRIRPSEPGAMTPNVFNVVSVTPVAVERDSRTYKQAASLAAHGYRSIVVEGVASSRRERGDLPFILISPVPPGHEGTRAGTDSPFGGTVQTGSGALRERWRALRRQARAPALSGVLFLAYLSSYLRRYLVQPLRRLPRADLYVLHEFSTYPAVRLRAALCGAPIVYDAHDFYSEIEPESELSDFARRWLVPFHRRIERACIGRAAAVLTISKGLKNLLCARLDAEAVVLRNLHDPRLDRNDAPDLRTRLGLASDAFLLTTVGNRKPGQALKPALEALARLPDHVHLAFVGAGYEDLNAEAARRDLAERVHTAGFLPLDEIVPALRAADASLVLYYPRSVNYEAALPNGLFQSIAAELPILYPELPEIAGLMQSGRIGLAIDPSDASSIVSAVTRLLANPDAAGRVGERRAFARAHEWAEDEGTFIAVIKGTLYARGSLRTAEQRGDKSTG
jgi:glycosyltransferase involved in cell wall biosynthesis